ncbi:RNA polymerase, sigma-24 subunit, ECF subfamily [Candidatus Vecturithrix granuli]|uniref:RNA polymerase, sigma-24 subunit, ECF subfamily n=1 Tax=Vecturithrix granuli TaxID=1499967 RepID=A0A081BVU1_VECG1|nr:RNA polymerase, sigma-24 subunit, ECF subfamily [Candidatus Vecturithrix granuli]
MKTVAETMDDLDIIRQILDGKVNAFEFLLERYQEHVVKIVKKHIPYNQIEEVTHDVFIRSYQSLPTFKNTSDFKHWLSSIAVRTCYDFWRKQYRERELPLSSLPEKQQHWLEATVSMEAHQAFSEAEDIQETRELLDWALTQLSPEDRMVIELVYLEEYSGKEAAKLLGWSVANVKVRSFRARKKLEKILQGKSSIIGGK